MKLKLICTFIFLNLISLSPSAFGKLPSLEELTRLYKAQRDQDRMKTSNLHQQLLDSARTDLNTLLPLVAVKNVYYLNYGANPWVAVVEVESSDHSVDVTVDAETTSELLKLINRFSIPHQKHSQSRSTDKIIAAYELSLRQKEARQMHWDNLAFTSAKSALQEILKLKRVQSIKANADKSWSATIVGEDSYGDYTREVQGQNPDKLLGEILNWGMGEPYGCITLVQGFDY